jgi:ADP-ribosylglycohydrolase
MLGAIIGDVIGSPYEFESDKTKDFMLFVPSCRPTDDSVLTIAVGCACAEANCYDEDEFKRVLAQKLKEIGLQYPDAGYGKRFYQWMIFDEDRPYGGNTNGSAMRVSPTAWAVDTLEDVERLAKWSAEITHNSSEGIRGAQAVAAAIFLARTNASKKEIKDYIEEKYYDLNFTLDEIRPWYKHDMTCDGSVPQAIACFLESDSFEDAIRNAVSLGGDGDTQACIAGAIAEAFYGIPDELQDVVFDYVDDDLKEYYWDYAMQLYNK